MKKWSFNAYVRKHGLVRQKEMVAAVPLLESWGDVRMYLRQGGATDDELAAVRALWRSFKNQ